MSRVHPRNQKHGDEGESDASRLAPSDNGAEVGGSGDGSDGDGGDDNTLLRPTLTGIIDKAARRIARQFGYSPEDTEDFCQSAHVYLLEKPEILAHLPGGDHDPNLLGYLLIVLRYRALDSYRREVGKWHSSANAKRLGPEAELLEALRYRDHHDSEAAIIKVLEKFPQLTRRRAVQLDDQLKPRSLREWVGDGPLEKIPAPTHADERIEEYERAKIGRQVQMVLREVLTELSVEDRVLVEAIFGKGQAIQDFALFQGLRLRQVHSRFNRLRTFLRRRLESEGITAEAALQAQPLEGGEAIGSISTASVRVRRNVDFSARIGQRYERIQALVTSGGSSDAIAEERRELRRLQHLEAAHMTAQAERRSHVAAGEGYAALEAAASLLAKK